MSGDALDAPWPELTAQLRRYIGRRVADPHTADDLVQEVLLRLMRQLQQGPAPESAAAWLLRTAHNAVVDHYRSRPADAGLPTDAPERGETDPVAAAPECGADAAPLCASLRAFVDALPAPQQQALVRTEFDGLSQTELAHELGVPLSTVKSRVQRGRQRLARLLHDCCSFELDRRGHVVDWQRWPDGDCPACG